MSRFWYILIFIFLVLGVWLFIKGCPQEDEAGLVPPYAGTIGFDSIKVEGALIMNILKPQSETFNGLRVYNAKMSDISTSSRSPGLILVATEEDSSEIHRDGSLKYVYIYPDGTYRTDLSQEDARQAVLEVVNDTNYISLITHFNYKTIDSFWRGNIPNIINIIPAKYINREGEFSSANFMYLSASSGGNNSSKFIISSEPCPPYCPSSDKLLYDPGYHYFFGNGDEDKGEDSENINGDDPKD